MKELIEWLIANKISYKEIDEDVIEICGFGKMYFENTDDIQSIFRKNRDGFLVFNSAESPEALIEEGINYVAFKFGYNFYYSDLRQNFKLNILKYVGEKRPVSNQTQFANLGIHTPYELLNGSFMPDMWVKKAKYCGHTGIGICDKNTMASCYALQKECESNSLKFVFGYSLTFTDFYEDKVGAKVYVQTQEGYSNLLRIQKAIMVDSEEQTILIEELMDHGKGNVLVLDKYTSHWIDQNDEDVQELKRCFDNVFFQVDLSEYKAERIDIRVLEEAKYYFDHIYNSSFQVPPVLLCDCYYLDKSDAKNKVVLNKISKKAAHEQSEEQFYKDGDDHYAVFEQLFDVEKWDIQAIFKECCDNSMAILNGAKARIDNTHKYMPKYDMTDEEKEKYVTPHNMFCQLLEEGLNKLVPSNLHEKYQEQMEFEKYIIESTDNVDYLLVQYDTCNWARSNGVLVGCGRGSAAGSLLLYLLGITLVDPLKYDLIFERFLLPERAGLYPAETTIIGKDIESNDFIEVTMENGKVIKIDRDAELIVKRESEENAVIIYADELQDGDDILFDNKDVLFTINEL